MTSSVRGGRSAVRLFGTLALALSLAVAGSACTSAPQASDDGEVGEPQAGGDLTVLLDAGFAGGWATGLDPATSNTTGANLPQNAAIFGGLFTLEPGEGGKGGQIVPNQAEGYEWSDDNLTLTVTLRDGITFTDGTPLNAEAVLWNWIRELSSGSTGAPTIDLNTTLPDPPQLSEAFLADLFAALPADVDRDAVMGRLNAIRVVDDLTIEMHLNTPNGSFVNGFPSANLNLIASPAAYKELGGTAFSEKPVGAGPFIVTANTQSQRLELEKNPDYFKDGLPYLDTLNFQSAAGDQVLYQSLLAGDGQVVEGLSSVTLIQEAKNNPDVQVELGAPTSPYVIQLNTRQAPFDDKKAREAIYYATDFDAINKGLFNDEGEMSQSFTASGGLFWHAEVPGYRTYDLEKAKALVDELGGLTVRLGTTDIVTARSVVTALQTQWKEAGIDVEIDAEPLGDVINRFLAGDWDSLLQTAGAWDPSVGIGVGVRFGSSSPFSGAPLPPAGQTQTDLDKLLQAAVATTDEDERFDAYKKVSQYISDEAYAPFGPAFSPAQVMKKGVHGPGLDQPIPALAVNQGVLYDRVWIEESAR